MRRRGDLRHGRLRPDWLESAVLFSLAIAIAYQLFVEPIVGVADNRDFTRLMAPAGLDYESLVAYREAVFRHVEPTFVYVHPSSHRYLTSERPILGAAKLLSRLLWRDSRFDIRALGACNLALYLLAVFVFLRAFRTQGRFHRLLVSGAVLLACVDVRWVAYFNSFYCESASLIFLFSTAGLALLAIDNQGQGRAAWLLWLGYLGSAFLFWMAKSQNTAFLPCLALGAWYCFPAVTHPEVGDGSAARPRGWWRSSRAFLVLRLAGTAAIPVGIVWAFAVNAYGGSTRTNADGVIAEEILPYSRAPADDRRELGVEQGGSAGLSHIASFYARHPIRWWRMAERQMQQAFGDIPYGNFTRAAGFGPNAQSQAFNLWSEFKRARYPRNLPLLAGLFLAYAILAGMKAGWLDAGRVVRMRTLVGPVLALGCALEFAVTVTFEANGTAKHLFLFNVAVDLCLLLAVLSAAEAAVALWRRRTMN
jgi:hypothetical protein